MRYDRAWAILLIAGIALIVPRHRLDAAAMIGTALIIAGAAVMNLFPGLACP